MEGVTALRDALEAGGTPTMVVAASPPPSPAVEAIVEPIAASGVPIHRVDPTLFPVLSATETPQGILGVFPFPELPLPDFGSHPALFVVADSLRDPGNLGTLLRSALGAGADAFFVTPGTADPYAPKVVRAGATAHFRLPIRAMAWDAPDPAITDCTLRAAADACADRAYDETDWTRPACLFVGSEASGLSENARALATERVAIPLAGGIESLNAAVAGSIILFEAARQRRQAR